MSEAIERFHIRVDDSVLEDLRGRLARTRFPDQIAGTEWEYGVPIGYLRELVEYWRDQYDWRAQEARLNQFAHYRTRIDGQAVHLPNPAKVACTEIDREDGSIRADTRILGQIVFEGLSIRNLDDLNKAIVGRRVRKLACIEVPRSDNVNSVAFIKAMLGIGGLCRRHPLLSNTVEGGGQ